MKKVWSTTTRTAADGEQFVVELWNDGYSNLYFKIIKGGRTTKRIAYSSTELQGYDEGEKIARDIQQVSSIANKF